MIAVEILDELRQRGVILEPNGDTLRYRAPKGVLTVELREALAANKKELLAILCFPETSENVLPTDLIELPFPIGYSGLPSAQVEIAEAVMDKWDIADPVLRKYNILCWVRGHYQDLGENHGEQYEALKQEQIRLGRILDSQGDS